MSKDHDCRGFCPHCAVKEAVRRINASADHELCAEIRDRRANFRTYEHWKEAEELGLVGKPRPALTLIQGGKRGES